MIKVFQSYDEHPTADSFSMHTHDDYEIFCFLEGNAQYAVEGHLYPLRHGDIILLRRSEAHYLILNSSAPYRRIVVNFILPLLPDDVTNRLMAPFNNRPLGSLNRYPASTFRDTHWLYYLHKLDEAIDDYQKLAYLTVLLEELSDAFPCLSPSKSEIQDNTAEILQYINHHLTEPLSLDIIAKHFFLSKSQLNRNFKKISGSTVWEYITAKRLLMAKELIQNGERPTTVFRQCGFSDYVTFYKSYKKRFGASPRVEKPSVSSL